MLKIADLKKVKTYEDLENLGIGRIYCDISHRGGGIGFYSDDVRNYFDNFGLYIDSVDLPNKFGAYCNYLGGGIRGSICVSGFNDKLWQKGTKRIARLLEELQEACRRVYENIDNEEIENDVMTGIVRVNQERGY